ncbi:MAG: UbiA family prenyltransferase [Bryobacterales bacterium]|nr:UbiA family prenyltransferase [Bryobacterales bacterium]
MLGALRLHQWTKNLLLLLPVVCAHQVGDWAHLSLVFWAFLFFSAGTSGQYLINDLLDLEADRAHPIKKGRAIASGRVSRRSAIVTAALLLSVSLAGAFWINNNFLGLMAGYHFLTLAYTGWLKHKAIVDVLLLACLYTLRVFAGGAATDIVVSQWLLTFSLFFFFMLAVLKRFAEMRWRSTELRVRDYHSADQLLLAGIGIPAGQLSVLVLAFYIQQPGTTELYHHPEWLWLLCPLLLYWASRMWLIAHRGAMPGDPLDFSLTDPLSYGALAAAGMIVYKAV